MSIQVVIEDFEETIHEKCCFCREPTPYWTIFSNRKPGGQVACCEKCALIAKEKDVPAKSTWCRRELIATGHFRRMF